MTNDIVPQEKIYAKGLTRKEYDQQRFRSKEGLVRSIYSDQKASSKRRGHIAPSYTLNELRTWIFGQSNFEALYQNWEKSGFEKMQRPSCDRLDDYKPYALNNIRLVTWQVNKARGYADIKNGINNKQSKAVLQLTREGIVINEYHSASHASRVTGVDISNLASCCRGKLKATGGFVWCYAQ